MGNCQGVSENEGIGDFFQVLLRGTISTRRADSTNAESVSFQQRGYPTGLTCKSRSVRNSPQSAPPRNLRAPVFRFVP